MASEVRSVGSLNLTLFLVLVIASGIVIAAAWVVTIATAPSLMDLLTRQTTGVAPVELVLYVSLVGIMMVAMMLPSAIPMLGAYRGITSRETSSTEAWTRTAVFTIPYFLAWTAFSAVALVILMAFGLMGPLSGLWILLPGAILIGAGIYQFTMPKQYCLTRCQSTAGFLLTHWRTGRKGAFRMGADHVALCIGCCWLLMLVVFVSGAMSLLWMGALTGIVLVEKGWPNGPWFSRVVGVACLFTGVVLLTLALVPVSLPG